MSTGLSKSEDLWTPYKELYRTANYYICEANKNVATADFEAVLRNHKQNFLVLLQNPPKSAKSREELKKGMEDGVAIKEIGHQILSKDLYQEAIILSDMYDLNEFVALDLLCTAQIQMPYHYGLPRGLVAVLLYYEGRKALVSSLQLLVQARRGVSWGMNLPEGLINFITIYTDQLMEHGIFNRIFELLRTLDLNKELEKLQENVALGGPRHRNQVVTLFNGICNSLAETVFLWSAQCGLLREPTLNLISTLRQLKIVEDASGTMDNVSFFLILALLSAMDLSIIHIREDGEKAIQALPILADKDYIHMLCTELLPSKQKWTNEGLQATSLFGLAVTVATLRLMPQTREIQSAIDKEVSLLCASLEMKVFEFLNYKLLNSETLYSDQVYMRRIHYLLTDFIVQMFPKVKELRIKADESARVIQVYANEGLQPPSSLSRYFENFMEVLTKFYAKDPFQQQFVLDFWCPTESSIHGVYASRAPPRAASLFKFVRLAGDMVPATLFVPFLNMLSSLSTCAQAARHCFNMLKQPGYSSTVTWDHFFTSFNQYYSSLRQETPSAETVYRRSAPSKGITPQEIEGLQAVLRLIRTIAEYDDFSRLALCEHPRWSPLTIFLGLVACPVPMPFKAELLLTLSALAKSPETASQTWNLLEASQILVTIPTTSAYQPRGIQTELDEVESRIECYPLTRAVLKLLDVLTDFGIPRTLGAGPRKPGFDPYLTFIVDSVFLKFNVRSYQNGEERWQIGAMCLKLLEKFLLQYEPQASDFNPADEFNLPPGFHLMLQLNSKSEFLNLILYLIEEGQKLFGQFFTFTGQNYLKECTLRCLNVLERALTLQATFFHLLSSLSSSIIFFHLSKLLLIINQRSGQPDYCLNISKYVGFQNILPKHALTSIKIVIHITASAMLHTQFLNILLSDDKESKLIRSGFVECLDANGGDDIEDMKEAILKLLKQCLTYSAPNLSHFLLGFDLRHDISQTLFQQPGVLDFPRNCLHSVFGILRCAVIKGVHKPRPSLLESTYNMLYLLCNNHKTSEPVLRYLRQNPHFIPDHLTFCSENSGTGDAMELNQLAWLLKTIAIELKVMCGKNQNFYLQQLTKLLVGMPKQDQKASGGFIQKISNFDVESNRTENLLLKLFVKFDLTAEEVANPKWNYFDNNALNNLLSNCCSGTAPNLIDIRKLHRSLLDEMTALHANSAVGQRQAIMQEVEKVLVHALNINNNRNAAAATVRYIDGWRQVAEVLAIYTPFEVLSTSDQQLLDIVLLESICKKAANTFLLPEIESHLSGAVLIFVENFRRCRFKMKYQLENANILHMNANILKIVITHLIEWTLVSNAKAQDVRINLYTSLVTFLQLMDIDTELQEAFYADGRTRINLPDKFVELICYDCIGGHDAVRTLAMASFSLLISTGGDFSWTIHLERRGYLKNIIQNVLASDEELVSTLDPVPSNLKPLYVYAARLLLLTQIAATRMGAELLLEQHILSCLSSMKVFSSHPEILKESQMPPSGLEDFIPPISSRYLQIFLPTLHLCNSIITSLSATNLSAVEQIIYYLISHSDVIEFVLRSGSPALSEEFLEQLVCLTSVIARTTSNNLTLMFKSEEGIQNNRAHLHRIQKLMLILLSKFSLTSQIIKELLESSPNRLMYSFQIVVNLIVHARNLICSNNINHTTACVIFQPTLGDTYSGSDQSPTLGTVVQHLINTVEYYRKERTILDSLQCKVGEIPTMSNTDLKEFLKLSQQVYDAATMREKAMQLASERLEKKKEEFEYCSFIIDNTLYLLWAHLDYYMLRAIPRMHRGEIPDLSNTFSLDATLSSASEATWKVSADDISKLKQGLVAIFNDSFTKQLLETAQGTSEVKKQFIENLIRKIKRLIQFVPVK